MNEVKKKSIWKIIIFIHSNGTKQLKCSPVCDFKDWNRLSQNFKNLVLAWSKCKSDIFLSIIEVSNLVLPSGLFFWFINMEVQKTTQETFVFLFFYVLVDIECQIFWKKELYSLIYKKILVSFVLPRWIYL